MSSRAILYPILFVLVAIAVIAGLARYAKAQHDHAAGHDVYKQWRSDDDTNCCDGRDCGKLAVDAERWTPAGQLEVQIEGAWCPVKPGMFVRKQPSPDWNVPHVCVAPAFDATTSPCERLRCYKGKGGF